MDTQEDNNINIILDDQDLEDVSILKDMEMEDGDVNVNVNQSRAKKKFGIKKEPRSVHWKDYERVKVMEGNPPIEVVKEECKRCEVLIAAEPRWFLKKEGMGRVSITSDCWKDIGESIITMLKKWGLTSLLCCTMDNAIPNDGAIEDVKSYLNKFNTNVLDGKYFLMRCVGYILNIAVQFGLEEIGTSMRRVREAVKWITGSAQKRSQWTNVVNILADRTDSKKALCLDVPTRWNFTYLMLQSAIPYEEAFQLYSQMYPSYRKDLSQKKHNDEFIGMLEKHD
ncbi:hypothetical protein SASPL_108527 [Salvia splendens]|uniref:Uncharacterized protein n=1 Tax=Salvia splendens TaxID=180675 RepID=A0A8X8YEX0_SALSN|nr:hypothetical protein SASPL_108527 [Salvia splendens]